MNTISKEYYLLNKIVERINKIKGNKEAKKDSINYYTESKDRLKNLSKNDIDNFDFEAEVKRNQQKYIELKKVEKLERHAYSPELNKLWFKDGTFKKVPGCTTIRKAVGL